MSHRSRRIALYVVLGLTAGIIPGLALLPAATAADPQQVNFTHEGCRNNGTITLPNGSGDFICPDAAYTTGNLGKGWNELDLVPYRLTSSAGNAAPASQTFTIAVVLDNEDAGHPGYDVLSALTLNPPLSAPSCSAATSGTATVLTPGFGGIDKSLYRLITITQAKNTNCVYDYYGRLAVGSHLFPGASLHANLANENLTSAGIGSKEVSIPVKEITPQELSKDMSASQGRDHVWSITKTPSPARIDFGDTCSAGTPLSRTVAVTVAWERLPATPTGPITVVTHVYAINPASRALTVTVQDVIYSGTTALDTVTSSPVVVPANTTQLVLTHSKTVPAGSTNLNDIATATYTDTASGVPIPQTTTATASANVSVGSTTNSSAVISDTESITGAGLQFAVTSVVGAAGSFGGGYVLGTKTVGPVSWTSVNQTGNGSVTFNKTVYAPAGSIITGSLNDTATVSGADGFSRTASLSIDVTTVATVSLTINKTISIRLGTGDSAATFTFNVTGPAGYSSQASVTFNPGDGGPLSPKSTTLTGLAPGTYTIAEVDVPPWTHGAIAPLAINLPSCSGSVTVANGFGPATAQVQKVTVPAGNEAGWTVELYADGVKVETAVTNGSGLASFVTALDEGITYSIQEVGKSGWDQSNAAGCANLTVNYPDDADRVLTCTFTNTQRGLIAVRKVTNPTSSTATFSFSGDVTATLGNGQTSTAVSVAPGTYTSTEAAKAGWDLTSIACSDANSTGSGSTATFRVEAGESVVCTFTNTQRGLARVVKTVSGAVPSGTQAFNFQLRSGASEVSAGTVLETGTANAGNGGVIAFSTTLTPGTTYQLCEQMQPGWTTTLGPPLFSVFNPSGDNSVVCTDFTVSAGQTRTFTVDNQAPPGGLALTIGYWKNWSSCSGGRQKPVLDQTLAGADPAGISVGLLTLHAGDCLKAVRILDKSRIDTGKKQASDPAFNMAAQLLAAKLNVAAGAGQCAASAAAITAGQALLVAVQFDGITHLNLTAAQRTLANSLGTTLDNYNNNTLC